jgi:Plavaka transposase
MTCTQKNGGGQLRYELPCLISLGRTYILLKKKVQTETRQKHITIVPIIISSDKTQLTTFRGKQAYPVYLTIGNLPKHIHQKPSQQGQVLLGYLPTSKLDHITNKASRR